MMVEITVPLKEGSFDITNITNLTTIYSELLAITFATLLARSN